MDQQQREMESLLSQFQAQYNSQQQQQFPSQQHQQQHQQQQQQQQQQEQQPTAQSYNNNNNNNDSYNFEPAPAPSPSEILYTLASFQGFTDNDTTSQAQNQPQQQQQQRSPKRQERETYNSESTNNNTSSDMPAQVSNMNFNSMSLPLSHQNAAAALYSRSLNNLNSTDQRRAFAAAASGLAMTSARPRTLSEREQFFLFVKILFKCLDLSGDPKLKPRAKAVVSECTRRNRMGDSNYTPLQDAVERRLRRTVGELYWARAKLYFDQYCQRKGLLDSVTPVGV